MSKRAIQLVATQGHLLVSEINKTRATHAVANMPDYNQEVAGFSWDKARAPLDGLNGNGLIMPK